MWTYFAPMDWKLQDSDETTQPSVSASPAPKENLKKTSLAGHMPSYKYTRLIIGHGKHKGGYFEECP